MFRTFGSGELISRRFSGERWTRRSLGRPDNGFQCGESLAWIRGDGCSGPFQPRSCMMIACPVSSVASMDSCHCSIWVVLSSPGLRTRRSPSLVRTWRLRCLGASSQTRIVTGRVWGGPRSISQVWPSRPGLERRSALWQAGSGRWIKERRPGRNPAFLCLWNAVRRRTYCWTTR